MQKTSTLIVILFLGVFSAVAQEVKPATVKNKLNTKYIEFYEGDTINKLQSINPEMKVGKWVYFRSNHTVKKEGSYNSNKMNGTWTFYDDNGSWMKEEVWDNDKLIEIHKLDKEGKVAVFKFGNN